MKKWLITALTLVTVSGLAAGCGGNSGNSGDANEGKSGTEQGGKSAKKTELTFWGDWGGEGQKQFETMVDAFNKSQDKIHVKYVLQQDMITKFLTAATNGGAPGRTFLGPLADFTLCAQKCAASGG